MRLEVLYPQKVADAKHPIHVDLVAVHGLNGHPTRTWTHRKTNALWLKDFLPQDVKNIRVMSFGYNASAAFGNTTATITDHAKGLLACLIDKREEEDEKNRQIIFVGHSLGGIVIKQALFQAKIEPRYQSISQATVGIIFLGTPHRGSEKASYGKVLAKVATTVMHKPAPALVTALQINSEALMRLTTDFRFQLSQYQVCSFYEMKPMRIFSSLIVGKHSSLLDAPVEDQIPVEANHEEMCKFADRDDDVYEKLFKRIRRMLKPVGINNKDNPNMPNALPNNQYYFIPHNSTGIFTGRDNVLRKLHDRFFPSQNESTLAMQKRFILYGLGGSGKTQICTKFAEVHREMFWGIFWIDATTSMTIEQGFRDIGQRCGIGSEPNVVKQWLSNIQQHWLLIIDNADNPKMNISTIFPVGNRGSILVTTRNPRCKTHATVGSHELGEMGLEEGVELFLRAADIEDASSLFIQKEARTIVNTMGCLTLAIVQAGAYVQQGLCSIGEYCDIYSRRREQLLNYLSEQDGSSYGFSVYTTWEVSLDAIESRSDKTSKNAIELIQILGFFHHDNIAVEIFEQAWKNTRMRENLQKDLAGLFYISSEEGSSEWDPTPIREAAALLASFSLIKLDSIHQSMSMHPLVHTWARDRLSEDSRHHYRAAAGYTLSSAISWHYRVSEYRFRASDYRFRRMLVPHIDSCLELHQCSSTLLRYSDEYQVNMAESFSLAFEENGRLRDSMELREKILEARQRTLGGEHAHTINAMTCLANDYGRLGRHQEAVNLMEKILETRQRIQGSKHPSTLLSMGNLAVCYDNLGRYEEAMDLKKKTLEARQRTLGSEHPDTLFIMNSLMVSYNRLGRQEEGMDLGKKTLEARQRILGSEHPDTLGSMTNLASSYSRLGRHKEAMGLQEKTVEVRQRTLGCEHPDTLLSMNNLASSYSSLGRYKEAIELSRKAFEGRKRILGSDHPSTLKSEKSLEYYNNKLKEASTKKAKEKTRKGLTN